MALFIQDPNDPQCPFAIDALLKACKGAKVGGGAFAYVTADGVELFLNQTAFKKFAARGFFDLVIGVDGITNPRALAAITAIESKCAGLRARAFLPGGQRSTFHPKFCWFRRAKGGIIVTGSGNMTGGGFHRNVEGFDCHEVTTSEIDAIERRWKAFMALNQSRLRPLKDPEVIKYAEANAIVERRIRTARAAVRKQTGIKTRRSNYAAPTPFVEGSALIAEIPKSKTRWKQANFNLETFTKFFGARPDRSHDIFLYHVKANGKLGPEEVRPSVSVKSRNYRFELDAATGLAYPPNGRPIGVFVRVAPDEFRYCLLMPGQPSHARIAARLKQMSPARLGGMRRQMVSVEELKAAWPNSPLWKVKT